MVDWPLHLLARYRRWLAPLAASVCTLLDPSYLLGNYWPDEELVRREATEHPKATGYQGEG